MRGRFQQGSVLVLSMIFLLILTLLVSSSFYSVSSAQRNLRGNQDREIAFQAAEAALLEAEDYLATGQTIDQNWIHFGSQDNPFWERNGVWTGGQSREYIGSGFENLGTKPRYVIEMENQFIDPESNNAVTATYYRITARAVGRSAETEVILQSIYLQ